MSKTSKRVSTFIFAFMAFVLVAGAIAPLFQRNLTTPANQPQPTPVPTATFPAPIADLASISFNEMFLHPTGLFAVAQPTGWEPTTPVMEPGRAGITMINNEQLSVIEASVEKPLTPITSTEALSERFDEAYLNSSWARYGSWEETARRIEDERVILDFNLTLNRQQYVARQVSWTDGDWIYNTRVVTPFTATRMLVYVLDQLAESVEAFKQFAGTPFDWLMYYDPVNRNIVRYPDSWVVEDAAPGRPASIVGPDGAALRLDARAGVTVTSAGEAESWLLAAQPNATILAVEPVERGGAAGFSVAYSFTTVDGDAASGLALLLNGADETLHIANLQFPAEAVDLNALAVIDAEPLAEATEEAEAVIVEADGLTTLADIMSTFYVLPPLNFTNVLAPTPLPTAPLVEEAVDEDVVVEEAVEENAEVDVAE